MTDAARVTERIRRPTFGTLEIDVTIDDPKAYTRPWTVTLHQIITLNTELLDFILADVVHHQRGQFPNESTGAGGRRPT